MKNLFESFIRFLKEKISTSLAQEQKTWYETLKKPFWTPPKWVFSPVWTALYITIGLAAIRIFFFLPESDHLKKIRKAFLIQIFANFMWSFLFFGLHEMVLSLLDMIVLWTAQTYTLMLLWDEDQFTAYLLMPYQLWITFAMSIQVAIFLMN